jgi:pimeloyl-ACP methyl ester carboxylesterase
LKAVRFIGRTAFKDPSFFTEDAIEEYSIALRTPQGRRATAQFLRVAIPPDAKERMARYPTLTHDILMIRGDHDGVLPDKSARRFCSEVPNARLLEIADCGHAPQEEKPAAVSSALLSFFA